MAEAKIKTIVWSKNASKQLYEILEYLSKHAPEALSIVGNALLTLIESLDRTYNNYPPDRFKKRNDGRFKAAVVFSYRISYEVAENTINILRIRHTSRDPKRF